MSRGGPIARRGAAWLAALVGAATVACVADGGPEGRIGFALTLPAADVSEIESVGFYALDVDPATFRCDEYVAGATDPIADNPESVVAARLEYAESIADGDAVLFTGIPQGRWTVLVECYDAAGRRIFLGCGDVSVEEGRTATMEVEMREDPLLTPR